MCHSQYSKDFRQCVPRYIEIVVPCFRLSLSCRWCRVLVKKNQFHLLWWRRGQPKYVRWTIISTCRPTTGVLQTGFGVSANSTAIRPTDRAVFSMLRGSSFVISLGTATVCLTCRPIPRGVFLGSGQYRVQADERDSEPVLQLNINCRT